MLPLLRGTLVLSLLSLHSALTCLPIFLLALAKLLPHQGWQVGCTGLISTIACYWAEINRKVYHWLLPTQWDIRCAYPLSPQASYLIICNHQTWADIPTLLQTFNGKTPFFRFFIKRELIWIPFLGIAFWSLDYPFMQRHSKAALAKKPHLQGQDLARAKRACEKFRHQPVAVVNYLEGTRFTPAKHQQQQSPYRYLLKPKSGGIAFALASLGEQLDAILDVTIVYPGDQAPGFWQLLSGQIPKILVDVQIRPLESRLWQGDYQNDAAFRQHIQDWVTSLWREKDRRIESLHPQLQEL